MRLRPLGLEDRDGLAALFARLSATSRYRRFMGPKPALTDRELRYLTDIDHLTHEAIAAVDQSDGSLVGVGRYVHYTDRPGTADVSLEVADDRHNMGIGTALAAQIVWRARANGVAVLAASTLHENRPARALLRRFGFRPVASAGPTIDFELDLREASPVLLGQRPGRDRS